MRTFFVLLRDVNEVPPEFALRGGLAPPIGRVCRGRADPLQLRGGQWRRAQVSVWTRTRHLHVRAGSGFAAKEQALENAVHGGRLLLHHCGKATQGWGGTDKGQVFQTILYDSGGDHMHLHALAADRESSDETLVAGAVEQVDRDRGRG